MWLYSSCICFCRAKTRVYRDQDFDRLRPSQIKTKAGQDRVVSKTRVYQEQVKTETKHWVFWLTGDIPAVVVLTGLEIYCRVLFVWDEDKTEYKCCWFQDLELQKVVETSLEIKTDVKYFSTTARTCNPYACILWMNWPALTWLVTLDASTESLFGDVIPIKFIKTRWLCP